MKTNKFFTYIDEATNSIMRVTTDDSKELLKTNDDMVELRSFIKKKTNFPNIDKVKDFIDWLDSYNDKIFEDWTEYVNISFKKSGNFIYFDIDVNEDVEMTKPYQQWYNQLTNKKPVIVYLIDDSVKSNPEKMERLYKVIKKMKINKNTLSTKDTLAQELEGELQGKLSGEDSAKKGGVEKVIGKYQDKKSGDVGTSMEVEPQGTDSDVDSVIEKYKSKRENSLKKVKKIQKKQ